MDKAELDKLLDACEQCAGKDTRSYEEHFGECPSCQDWAEQAEKLNEQIQFLEDLAAKPEEKRKTLLGARMRKYLGMPPEQRKSEISELLDGLSSISEGARMKVVKTRTDIMMEVPKEHRETLMGVLGDIMKEWTPERKMMEKQAVLKATEDYFFLKRMMVRKKFGKLLE